MSFLLSSQVFAFGQVQSRNIVAYQPIEIQSPAGTVPRLPYQVRVTYSDGTIALRQVKWENAALATEQMQADSLSHPVGKLYTIKGY
ncbi:MAG: Ig-like domain-containing protein, partial [Paraprevotella sp.]|nr:Ig-like domain-containing protein [Paraprevotella sp.]